MMEDFQKYRRVGAAAMFVLAAAIYGAAAPANSSRTIWESTGQREYGGFLVDIFASGNTVAAGGAVYVNDAFLSQQWYVRGMDKKTGETKWEDRFGPVLFGDARDLDGEGNKLFATGWIYTPGIGYEMIVRAYDRDSGEVLWSRRIRKGSQCVPEAPRFLAARCVAKALDVLDGKVFVAGHLTRTQGRSDFAVLAFDAATGEQLWESVTDPTGTGRNDYAWAVHAAGDKVFVSGEIGNQSALLLRAYDAATGAILWEKTEVGGANRTNKDSLTADARTVYLGGSDANHDFMLRAYDAETGALLWSDIGDDGSKVGYLSAVVTKNSSDDGAPDGRIYATGFTGCDPGTYTNCDLTVRGYERNTGRIWQRTESATGGFSYYSNLLAGGNRVYVNGVRSIDGAGERDFIQELSAADGEPLGEIRWDEGSNPGGFVNGLFLNGNRLYAGGYVCTDADCIGSDFKLRAIVP